MAKILAGPFNTRGEAQDALYDMPGDKNKMEIEYINGKWYIVAKQ